MNIKDNYGYPPFFIADDVDKINAISKEARLGIKNTGLLRTLIQQGAVGPGWQPYDKEREEQLAHKIKIYNNANEKKYLMKCDADSYFRLTNCLYENKKIEKKI